MRKRLEDISFLIKHFLINFDARFSDKIINKLQRLRWPGNVRELELFVSRAVQAKQLTDEQLTKRIKKQKRGWAKKAVKRANGNKKLAAQSLEISRATLDRWLDE